MTNNRPVWEPALEHLLPAGDYSSRYDIDVKDNAKAEEKLSTENKDILYRSEFINGQWYLMASVKMPSNEVKHFQFEINEEGAGKHNISVVTEDKGQKIKSIPDFIEKKIFDEKIKMFSGVLGKDNPQAIHFATDGHLQFARNSASVSMEDITGHLSKASAGWNLTLPDPQTNKSYDIGKFFISQPEEPDKKNNFLDVSVKISDKVVSHLRFEFRNGGIYPEGKIDAANRIEDMSAHINKFASDAANILNKFDNNIMQKLSKLHKNVHTDSQQISFNQLKNQADDIRKQISNGEIKDEVTLSKAISDKLKEPLSQMAKRDTNSEKYKTGIVSKIKNAFRSSVEKRAEKILNEVEKPVEEEQRSTITRRR